MQQAHLSLLTYRFPWKRLKPLPDTGRTLWIESTECADLFLPLRVSRELDGLDARWESAVKPTDFQLADLPRKMEAMNLSVNQLTGSLDLETLPAAVRTVCLSQNKFTADPMDGHLSVVGRTTTPSWGKPGATRFYGDPPWRHRVTTRASSILHCHGILASVANTKRSGNKKLKKQETKKLRNKISQHIIPPAFILLPIPFCHTFTSYLPYPTHLPPWCTRMRAARDINLSLLLLRAGDVHPNPGPALRIAQFNILGFTPGRRLSLLHKAITHNLDVLLLQELHVTEDEASRLTLDGYKFFAVSRNARGG